MRQRASATSWIIAVIVLIIIIVIAWWILSRGPGDHLATAEQPAGASTASIGAGNTVAHPIANAESITAPAGTAAMPSLNASDSYAIDALVALSSPALRPLLMPQQVIPRIVATVDALPRQSLGNSVLPVHNAHGALATQQIGDKTVLAPVNAKRYSAYMQALEHADSKTLVSWYAHNYPLFQKAYVQLGYPKGYFNDRLVATIDNLLATPEVSGSPALVAAKGGYAYADPSLQSLSIGQRTLLRTGPADEAKVKAKLREIRRALTGAQLAPASADSAR